MTVEPTCRTHLARAGWTCSQCNENLCRRCAWWRAAGHEMVVVCKSCQAFATPIMVPRPMASFGDLLRHVFDYPWAGQGKYVLASGFFFFALLAVCLEPGRAFSDLLLISYLFYVVRWSWTGQHEPPGFPDAGDIFSYWATAFRGAIAFGLSLLPIAGYVSLVGWHWYDPFAWLCGTIGLVWAPIGIMRTAAQASLGEIVDPVAGWHGVRRMGRDYLVATAVFWTLAASWFGLCLLADWIEDQSGILILPQALMMLPKLYVAMMAARVLGIVLFTHGADIGYGREVDYLVPILGSLMPQDEAPPPPEETAAQPEPIAIDLPSPSTGPPVELFVPYQPGPDKGEIELDEDPPPPLITPSEPPPPPTAVEEDLMSEDQFMAMVFPAESKK